MPLFGAQLVAGRARPRKPKPKKSININTPGYTPDWKALIEADPTFMGHKGRLAGLSNIDKANRNAAIKARLIAFGSLPSLEGVNLGDFGIDPETIAAIQANTNPNTSETARLQRENAQNVQALQDMLAARGMLRSGSLGVGLGQEQERFTGAQTNARTELLRVLAGLQNTFAEAEAARENELYGPGGLAEQTQENLEESGLYEPTEATTTTAVRDPATGLYKDASGNYYDANGNRVNPTTRGIGRELFRRQKNRNRGVGRGARRQGHFPPRFP